VTVTAETTAELRRQRDQAANADLVELRLDSVRDPDVAGALAGRTSPVIVTCRPAWEGGDFRGSEEERKRLLTDALAQGAEYVDVEWRAGFADLIASANGRRIVLSMHDFDGLPADLPARARAMESTGAEVVKIAVKANCLLDSVTLLQLGAQMNWSGRRGGRERAGGLVLIGMGDYGLATRILPGRFGSVWTYAGAIPSIGQLAARTMEHRYRFREIGDATRIYGVVAGSVKHSVSPAMHNAAFRALNVDAVYLPLPAASAGDFVAFGKALGMAGASVTVPYKVAIVDHLDEINANARRVGAVNTIRVESCRWIGDNTDVGGFLEPLEERRVALAGLRAAVLGAGGAARAVVDGLISSGCSVTVHARQRSQAEQLAAFKSAAAGSWPPRPGTWDLLVNCTPVGQFPRDDETPVPIEQLTGRCVYDLVYNPPVTRLLREAADAGCETVSGLDMLVAQAHEQFRWWTGARAPAGIMREAALERLSEYRHDEDHII
jgi:3-dehydroquinate dehydratase/shikimate dehydrogenase